MSLSFIFTDGSANHITEGRCTDVSSQTHGDQVVHGGKQRAVTNTEVELEIHVYLCDRVEPSKLKRGRQYILDCSMEKAATTLEKAVEVIKKVGAFRVYFPARCSSTDTNFPIAL